jgi:hypothetical protein
MTQFYRAVNGVVAELFTPPAGVTIAQCFTAALAAEFVAVPSGETPQQGWIVNADGTLSAPVVAPPTQAQLLGAASSMLASLMAIARTYALGGSPAVSVKCDGMQGTGSDLAGLNAWGAANPTATTTWVDDFGVPTTITGAQGVTLALAVVAYGQSVYDVLGTAAMGIAAGTITTVAQVNALAWPT